MSALIVKNSLRIFQASGNISSQPTVINDIPVIIVNTEGKSKNTSDLSSQGNKVSV